MYLPFQILKLVNHGSIQFWSVSKSFISFHPLYNFIKSRSQIFMICWLDVWFWELLPSRNSCFRGQCVLAKASTAKLPGSELQQLPWGGGCSAHGAQDHSIIVSFSFPVLEKASNCCPKRGDPLPESTERDYRRDWTVSKAAWRIFFELPTIRSSQLLLC